MKDKQLLRIADENLLFTCGRRSCARIFVCGFPVGLVHQVYIRDMTTVTPLMLALFGGSLQVHHERQVSSPKRTSVSYRSSTRSKHVSPTPRGCQNQAC